MNYIAQLNYQYTTNTPRLARLQSGFFIKEILKHFYEKINGTLQPLDRSLYLYVAHDYTVGNLLNSLKLFKVFLQEILTQWIGSIITSLFVSYSHIFRPTHAVFTLNCTEITKTNTIFSCSIGILMRNIHCHWRYQTADWNVHWQNFLNCLVK